MSAYKLIALDMDGTVLNDDQLIPAENKEWIKKALDAGVTVCFATGRELRSVLPFTTELDLKTPLITVNGSEVWENPDKLLKRHLIDAQWIEKLAQIVGRHGVWFWATAVDQVYNPDNWHTELKGQEWLKFGFHTDDDAIRHEVYDIVSAWDVMEITNSHPHNLEFNPKGINKASALEEVCRLLDIQMSEVVAMGDSTNDTAMIRAAGLGVAMGNAQDGLKKIADMITTTNNENGVAKIIREVILK